MATTRSSEPNRRRAGMVTGVCLLRAEKVGIVPVDRLGLGSGRRSRSPSARSGGLVGGRRSGRGLIRLVRSSEEVQAGGVVVVGATGGRRLAIGRNIFPGGEVEPQPEVALLVVGHRGEQGIQVVRGRIRRVRLRRGFWLLG